MTNLDRVSALATLACAFAAAACSGGAVERAHGPEAASPDDPTPEPGSAQRGETASAARTSSELGAAAADQECGSAQATSWSRDLGAGHHAVPSDVTTDPAGNVLHAMQAIPGEPGGGLTKLGPDGVEIWSRPYGSVVASDDAGNVIVAGAFDAPLDLGFGPLVPSGGADVFVAKLSPDGQPIWARKLGTSADDAPRSLAVDSAGKIALSALTAGTFVFDGQGNPLWEKPFAGALAYDSGGNLLVTGGFVGSEDFGAGPVQSGGASDAFVVKLDPDGKHLFSHVIGDAGNDAEEQIGTSISVDAKGDVILVGELDGGISLFGDAQSMPSAGEQGRLPGAFVAKLDPAGNPLWHRISIAVEDLFDVTTDPDQNLLVAGSLVGDVVPFRRTFVQKLDPGGTLLWEREQLPSDSTGVGAGHGVATDRCGAAFWSAAVRMDGSSPEQPTRALLVRLEP
jgi:hypothetical protein